MKRKQRVRKNEWVNPLNMLLMIFIVVGGLYVLFLLFNSYIYNAKQGNSQNLDIPCLEAGKRYTIDEAAQDPAKCDIEIATDEDFTKLSILSQQLKNLRTIYFRKTPNTKLPINIAYLENLNSLNFHHTFKTSLPPEIGRLKNLKVINMNKADVNVIPPEMGELIALENLSIINNAGRVELPSEIGRLKNLKVLAMSGSPELILPVELGELESLQELYIDDSNFNSVPEVVFNLTNLQLLNLSYNNFSSSEVEEVKQALPNTTVIFQN